MKLSQKTGIVIIGTILFFTLTKGEALAVTGKITTETLKLRKGPSTDTAVLELMSIGEKVEVIQKEGDWYKITYNEIEGYAHQDYIELEEKLEEEKPEETTKPEEKEPEETTKPEEKEPEENRKKEEQPQEPEKVAESIVSKEGKIKEETALKILPLIHSKTKKTIEKDVKVVILEVANRWVYVSGEGITGWVLKDNIQLEEQSNHTTENNNGEEEPEERKK